MKKLTTTFYKYFYGKVDIYDYDGTLQALRALVGNEESVESYDVDNKETFVKEFVLRFYRMKEKVKYRFESIQNYSNSIEGQARPLMHKLTSKKAMAELAKLYPKFDKFMALVNSRLNIAMPYIYYEATENKKNNSSI